MPVYIPPAGYLLIARTRVTDARSAIDRCIAHDPNHVDLQARADEIATALRFAADCVLQALAGAEEQASMVLARIDRCADA